MTTEQTPVAHPPYNGYAPYPPPYIGYPPGENSNGEASGAPSVPPFMMYPPPPGMMFAYPPPAQGFAPYPPPPASNGVPSATQVEERPKRRQVKMACTNCAAACKRCDESRPCQRCQKYGLIDSCVDGQRKERKKGIKRGPYKRKPKEDQSTPPAPEVEWPAHASSSDANPVPPPPTGSPTNAAATAAAIQAVAAQFANTGMPPVPDGTGFFPFYYPPPYLPVHDGNGQGGLPGENGQPQPPMVPYYVYPHYVYPPPLPPPIHQQQQTEPQLVNSGISNEGVANAENGKKSENRKVADIGKGKSERSDDDEEELDLVA